MKKLLYGNLFLRVVMLFVVLILGHWHSSDSLHYLRAAQEVCSGRWGGDISRSTSYLWYLCGLSPSISMDASAAQLILPLFLQTLIVWFVGFWIYKNWDQALNDRQENKKWIPVFVFWLYDPVLLIYSHVVMSDAFFAVSIFFTALNFEKFLNHTQNKADQFFKRSISLGLCFALTVLTRPVGVPLMYFTVFVLFIWFVLSLRNKTNFHPQKQENPMNFLLMLKSLGLVFFVYLLVLSPRLYWNWTQNGFWGTTSQNKGWVETVAAAVEYHGTGLDFYQAEAKWFREHAQRSSTYVYETLFQHFPTWMYLNFKGMMRVLFGHVNVEWSYFFTGQSPIGPGWFKVPEQRSGPRVEGLWTVLWVLGVLTTGLISLGVYLSTLKGVRRLANSQGFIFFGSKTFEQKIFIFWLLGSIFVLAFIPQVWGDARFRMALWPLVLFLYRKSQTHENRKQSEPEAKI